MFTTITLFLLSLAVIDIADKQDALIAKNAKEEENKQKEKKQKEKQK